MKEIYSEELLKIGLTGKLPDTIKYEDTNIPKFWWKEGEWHKQKPVTDREWLFIVSLTEDRLTDEQWHDYYRALYLRTRPENHVPKLGCDEHTKAFIGAKWNVKASALMDIGAIK